MRLSKKSKNMAFTENTLYPMYRVVHRNSTNKRTIGVLVELFLDHPIQWTLSTPRTDALVA